MRDSPRVPNQPADSPGSSAVFARSLRYALHSSIALPLLLLALLTVLLVSPRGEFPLNDDWVYTKAVQRLLEHGEFAGHPFAAALTVAQMLWGALFCKLFGFSFSILRVSTLVLGYVAAWAAARSACILGLSRSAAVLCGALVFSSPLVLNLSYTFMTDVPFLSMSACAGMFYLRALERPAAVPVFWGSVFGVLACLTRQFGVLLPAVFAAAILHAMWWDGYRPTRRMLAAFFATWAVGGALMLFFSLTRAPGLQIPSETGELIPSRRLLQTLHYGAIALTYMGLFVLPLGAARLWRWGKLRDCANARGWTVFLIVCAAVAALLCKNGIRRLPKLGIGNMLYDLGVGPMTLSDAYQGYRDWMPVRLGVGWWPLTVGAVLTAGLLTIYALDLIIKAPRAGQRDEESRIRDRQRLFLLLWGGAMVACPWNPWLPKIFDRYFAAAVVPCVLFLGSAALRVESKGALRVAWLGCALMYAFSVGSLHDYLGWNHARWEAIRQLQVERQVPANRIDGGFEFNGMYTSDEYMQRHQTQNFFDSGKKGYWILDNEYVIGITEPRPGYEVVARVPYFSWLGMQQCHVVAFHRSSPQPTGNDTTKTN